VSPFMFYAGQTFPAVPGEPAVARRLGGRACGLVPLEAYARLAPPLQAAPATRRMLGERALVLVSGSAGGCPSLGD